ncbi:MAG: hypothetical protein JKY45_10190 [Emcibacter sp.]|nr:hypothetical protein [Emcibacter sp.]
MTEKIEKAHATLPPLRALIVLMGVVVLISGYMVIAHFLDIHSTFAGMFLVFYLFGVEGGELQALPKSFIGALGGMATAIIFAWPGLDPDLAGLLGLVAVLVAIYCLLIGFAPILFNHAFMLYLTVVLIPVVLLEADFTGMLAALVLSGVYFGGFLWVVQALKNRKMSTESA